MSVLRHLGKEREEAAANFAVGDEGDSTDEPLKKKRKQEPVSL